MKIAIVKLSALGDIVHAMVVLQYIKKYNQTIEIDWLVEENYKELLESHPDINKVHVVNIKKAKQKKSLFSLLKELIRVHKFGPYDLVIDMQGLIKSAIISRLISSPITLGFDKASIRESLASIFYNKTFNYDYDKNVIERNFELIKFALNFPYKLEEINYKVPFLYSHEKHLNLSLSNTKKNIILIPGASHPSKRYPVNKLAELSLLFDAHFLIIWGNQEEKILADRIQALSPDVFICEKLTIDSLKSLISKVDLVIGPDTGPTHIAWALNVASITLFGPTPSLRNAYQTDINRIIESKSDVNPYKIDKNDYSIKGIKVDDIVKMSHTLLKLNK
jgi:heptosyltransferase I